MACRINCLYSSSLKSGGRSSVAKNFLITESFSSRISAFEDRGISTSSSSSGEEDLEDEGDNETGLGVTGGKNACIQGLHGDYIVIF